MFFFTYAAYTKCMNQGDGILISVTQRFRLMEDSSQHVSMNAYTRKCKAVNQALVFKSFPEI